MKEKLTEFYTNLWWKIGPRGVKKEYNDAQVLARGYTKKMTKLHCEIQERAEQMAELRDTMDSMEDAYIERIESLQFEIDALLDANQAWQDAYATLKKWGQTVWQSANAVDGR